MIRITNESEYPTREVNKLVRQTLGYQDITRGVSVVVRHFVKRTTLGQQRTWMGGGYDTWAREIEAKIVKPGYQPRPYNGYERKREKVPKFELADWREQLVAIVAHEAKHHLQRPGPYVESDADYAAMRAVRYYREDLQRRGRRR